VVAEEARLTTRLKRSITFDVSRNRSGSFPASPTNGSGACGFAKDVARQVEDRRLTLAERTHHLKALDRRVRRAWSNAPSASAHPR
jgi:hypothetical protein